MAEETKKTESYLIAEADSKDCEDCLGEGMATVYAQSYDGSALRRDDLGNGFVARTMAHCRCPLGRLIRASSPEDVRRRTPDVIEILEGRSLWLPVDPTEKSLKNPHRRVTQENIDRFWIRIKTRPVLEDVRDIWEPKETAWSIQTSLRQRLCRVLDLDMRVADHLTIDELLEIQEHRQCPT